MNHQLQLGVDFSTICQSTIKVMIINYKIRLLLINGMTK